MLEDGDRLDVTRDVAATQPVVHRVGRHEHHFRRQQVHALTEGNFLIRIWINDLQESLYSLGGKVEVVLRVLLVEAQVGHHLPELGLIYDAVPVAVHRLKVRYDAAQELFVLSQLEV